MLVWFATMVTSPLGLGETKLKVAGADRTVDPGLRPHPGDCVARPLHFFLHYFFASITAHTASMLPVFTGVAVMIPGLSAKEWARCSRIHLDSWAC